MTYTIVGVIGHIDHGKTSLVAALTGVETDTHPEEKRRGITIDLGFASYVDGDQRFALIDAPGHQKYIGNLLAGVSAVDVGLLVVACDQGIQAQTLEHAAILQSLGVRKLIVAISRIDLADAAQQQELREELDFFLADYGFREIPKVAVSVVTGEGLDELREQLRIAARTEERSAAGSFRMPIDRVFTKEGRGCVVAGTPWVGSVQVGDQLQLARTGQLVRVRGLEVHGQSVEVSRAGLRTAMNLAGISATDLARGDELLTEHHYPAARRLLAQITMFQDAQPLRCPATVQLHTATTACSVRILGVKRLQAAEDAIVILEAEDSVVATYQQKCLFRRPYPVGSFAGGRILASLRPSDRKSASLLKLGRALQHPDAGERLSGWIEFRSELTLEPAFVESQLGVPADQADSLIQKCVERGQAVSIDGRLVSPQTLDRVSRFLVQRLHSQAESQEDAWIDEESLLRRLGSLSSVSVGRQALQQLISSGNVVRVNRMVAIASEQTVLTKKQQARMNQLLEVFENTRTPPSLKELAAQFKLSTDAVGSLLRFATQQRILLEIADGLYLSTDVWNRMLRQLSEQLASVPELAVAEIRDTWNVTRKYAIPMLEYCDRNGYTIRRGDVRAAGPALAEFARGDADTEATERIESQDKSGGAE